MRALGILALIVLLCAALGWMACVRRDRVAAPGEELVYDDFGFSVQNVQRSGTLWIVDLKVANHARRVSYRLDHHQVAIVDDQGTLYKERPVGDATPIVAEIAHGETCVVRHVFDLPDGIENPRLKIRFGDVGSALDFVLLGDWSLALR